MMKKTVYTLFVVCLSLLMAGTVSAQTCKSDWTFTAQPQESTCQANGVITVTMGGDMTNITGMQYSVSSTNGGRNVEPQPNNVIGNLPPATYTVTVRAFCAVDADYTVVKEQMNVVVPGTYQVPVATLNANSSRKSYADPNLSDPAFCGSGRIAIDVVKGSGNFTFEITAAPAGVTLGAITPTKSGASLYTLPGETYPAGAYTILVNDGCYTAACNFTLEGISGFPSLASTSQSVFYPTNINSHPILCW